ncbi:GspH/FimT family pseudopilin [Dyella solisilvae]|uniref:GspH/FimT family pseudopilin n=1 Tax=Dyella solisilvae TaxID=1920168 RepID=UPI002279ABAA|nr:GspH/FimT family pseudopilin [Dyella solisilvae]
MGAVPGASARNSQPVGAPTARRAQRGFTMAELMITVAVAATLTAMAVPAFSNMINANRLTTAANAMIGALNTARMEAIKRNGSVQFCSNSASSNNSDVLGTACGTSAGAVVELTGAATASSVLAPPTALSIPSVQVRNIAAIRFNGSGLGTAPGSTTPFGTGATGSTVVEICSTALHSNNDIQVSMATGSIVTSTTSSTATCP